MIVEAHGEQNTALLAVNIDRRGADTREEIDLPASDQLSRIGMTCMSRYSYYSIYSMHSISLFINARSPALT